MTPRDRERFAQIIHERLAAGDSLTAAIQVAYEWLLKRGRDVWPNQVPRSYRF